MVSVWVEQVGDLYFGVAGHDGQLVATVTGRTREEASRRIEGFLPAGAPFQVVDDAPDFLRQTVLMLARIEQGDETGKTFELSATYVPEPKRSVLRVAAAIPLGYATTYGDIAARAGTNARVVGGIMATNSLYPIVPCHRVVGADFALVGYGGKQTAAALGAKLGRLRAEARGFTEEQSVAAAGGLRVLPVEWVIARAARDDAATSRQLSLW
jgi:methylated-DNA-[protein]-cysteine S-methyltransferase